MSHAANLRNRQRPTVQESPAKRRRIEPNVNGLSAVINGTVPSKFIAVETTDVKKSKGRQQAEVDAVVTNGDEDASMLDVVPDTNGNEVEDSQEESDESTDEEDEDIVDGDTQPSTLTTSQAADGAEEPSEPSFGDLLRARAPETIAVEPSATAADLTATTRTLTIPTATSLGTVLTQALRTNDVDLLESCLQVPNLDSIRATIERLHSSLATNLLQKLAERLHRRPGRAGSLMVWVQWTIVAHGGYLANQPAAVKQLHTLYNVVKQRAAGLQPLLSLKGKLDMLEAQMRLRQNMQDRIRPGTARNQDEAGVVYVEGEEDQVDDVEELDDEEEEDSDESEIDEIAQIAPAIAKRTNKRQLVAEPIDLSSDDDEDDTPNTLPNGVDGTDEDGSSDNDDEEDLIDDEAEESDGDDSDLGEEGIDYDEDDLIDDASSEEEEQKPIPTKSARPQTKGSRRN